MAKKKAAPAEKQSAGGRLKAQGKSLIWVAPNAEQKQMIRMAAASLGVPMSRFLLEVAIREAETILNKMKN